MRVTYRSYYPMYVVDELAPHEYPVFAAISDKEGHVNQQLADHNNVLDGRGSGWNMDTQDDRLIEPSTGLEWGAAAGDKPPLIRWKYGPGTSTVPRWEEKGTGGLNIVIADNQSFCLVNGNNTAAMDQSLTFTPDDFDATIRAGRGNLQLRAATNIQIINDSSESYYTQFGTTVASPTGTLLDATLHYVRVGFNAGMSVTSGQSLLFVGSTTELINDGSTGIKINGVAKTFAVGRVTHSERSITGDDFSGSIEAAFTVMSGDNTGTGPGVRMELKAGTGSTGQKGGNVLVLGGLAGTGAKGGNVTIAAGDAVGGLDSGLIRFGKASDTDMFGDMNTDTGVATWKEEQNFEDSRLRVPSGADADKPSSWLRGELWASEDKNNGYIATR
jgi:hypothetical protein